jgi:hypothetical protein
MSLASAYQSLTPEQKQILESKSADLNLKVDEMIALLEPVAKLDTMVGKGKASMGCSIALLVIATIGTLIVLPSPYRFLAPLVCIVALYFVVRKFTFASKLDVSDNLAGFAVPMLKLLRDDFHPDQPMHVKLDLREPTAKAKATGTGEPYKSGAYYKIIDTTYQDNWFSGEGVLADGSRFRWTLEETIRESKKSKKTPRGKYKTKTKYKKKACIDVELVLKKKTYDVEGAAKESDKNATMRVSKKYIHAANEPIPLDPMLQAVAGIYAAAKPAK